MQYAHRGAYERGVTDYADCVTGAESENLIKKTLIRHGKPVVGGFNHNSWNKNKLRIPPPLMSLDLSPSPNHLAC